MGLCCWRSGGSNSATGLIHAGVNFDGPMPGVSGRCVAVESLTERRLGGFSGSCAVPGEATVKINAFLRCKEIF